METVDTTVSRDTQKIIYPWSDGKPMADNSRQFRWITTIHGNLDLLFDQNPNVFVAGDMLWYPTTDIKIRQAPDIMVVFGRPKGDRGSYAQADEAGIGPQVVFEILSPGNRRQEMADKFDFYNRYGVEEYYLYDPFKYKLQGWQRQMGQLKAIPTMNGWVSPHLGIEFAFDGAELVLYHPDGNRFLTYLELGQRRAEAEKSAEREAEARIRETEARLEAQEQAKLAEERAKNEEQARTLAEERAKNEEQARTLAEERAKNEEQARLLAEKRAQALEAKLREAGLL